MSEKKNISFNFGENWQAFSQDSLDADKFNNAVASLEQLIGLEHIKNRSFLDIGCGSGIFAIAASLLGAKKVIGLDISKESIAASLANKDKLAPQNNISYFHTSIFEDEVAGLGMFDIVYSWGVLHHTGDMDGAIDRASQCVAAGGLLVIAIYNKHWSSGTWKQIKWFYNAMPKWVQKPMVWIFYIVIALAKMIVTQKNPFTKKKRGMSFYYDVVDWVGGYPYEYASKEEIIDKMKKKGFTLVTFVKSAVPTGCNEFVFSKNGKNIKSMTTESPIHICFVAPKAYPIFNPDCKGVIGGAEVDLYLAASQLAKDPAFQTSFITADYGQPQQETREDVAIFKSLSFRENSLFASWKIWRAMKMANADIYVQEAVSWGTFFVFLFCRIHRKKFVYRTAHSRECDGTYIKKNLITGKLFLWIIQKTNCLITQNQSDKINLKTNFGVESEVISNAIRCNINLSGQRDRILWVARSSKFKHPKRLLELAPSFPAQTFVMICPKATEDEQYEQLQQKASAIPNIRFIPQVNYNEIDTYFAQAKVFVNTSDSEGFPNTFVQAAAAGTAILSYAVNPDDFLTRYNCGISCLADMDKLRQGLAFLLENSRYLEIGQNGRKYAEQTHDITKIIEQYKTIFRSLVGRETQ